MTWSPIWLAALGTFTLATPAWADELWLGLYEHDVTLAQTRSETGRDLKAGWIGGRIDCLGALGRPSPHILLSKSLNDRTNYVAAGLNWTLGRTWYVRPGIGLAIHDGPNRALKNAPTARR